MKEIVLNKHAKNTALIFFSTLVFCSCGNDKMEIKEMRTNTTMQADQKKGFKIDIEKATVENTNFRQVLYTASNIQLVLMSLKPGEDIGEEVHPETDQFFRFESGNGKCIINGTTYKVQDGDAIIIPAGAKHKVINSDNTRPLKMYTLYSPPHHKDGIVKKTKSDAKKSHEEFDGVTSEGF